MIAIDEEHLTFEFGPEWDHVEKWDDTRIFLEGVGKIDGVRALDIIALSKTLNKCLLIEVKDYRDKNAKEDAARQQNEAKQKKGKSKKRKWRTSQQKPANASPVTENQTASALAEQVAKKVAGTLAGLVGAARMENAKFPAEFASALTAHKSLKMDVRVVLWVEGRPTSGGQSVRGKANLQILTQSLKRKIAWLTGRSPLVLSSTTKLGIPIPGIVVTDNRP